MRYVFETSGVDAKGEDITEMVNRARRVPPETFFKYVDVREAQARLGYIKDGFPTLKRAQFVELYKSKYIGTPCFFIVHSAIEYVWVQPNFVKNDPLTRKELNAFLKGFREAILEEYKRVLRNRSAFDDWMFDKGSHAPLKIAVMEAANHIPMSDELRKQIKNYSHF